MASTPSNRLKLTPSNSPFLSRPSRSPIRGRSGHDSRLSLRRVVGTTCGSPTGFDTLESSFAYIAGGAVVVVDVQGEHYSQRFFRARPTAIPIYSVLPVTHAAGAGATMTTATTPNTTPKANDSRNRVAPSPRDSLFPGPDWSSESSTSKTWTSRERIKAATCLALSRDGRFLAVGETGYAPRVLIFSLQDSSSDTPLVSISEHSFGVNAVAWSPDTKYLASLGAANDGFLYLWKIEPRTGAAKLLQQNRCTSYVRDMVWMGNNLITLGVRHVKVWRVEDAQGISPIKSKFQGDGPFPGLTQAQKPLSGRNILLGSMLDATFTCAVAVDADKAIICSETGDVCLLDDTSRQMKLSRILGLGFAISCVSVRNGSLYTGGKAGQFAVMDVQRVLHGSADPVVHSADASGGLVAMGFLAKKLVTIDTKRSIDIWSPEHVPTGTTKDKAHIPIPGHGDPIVGIQRLARPNRFGADFFTWSGSGAVHVWTVDGLVKSSFDIPIEHVETGNESDPLNQLATVKASKDGSLFFAGDKVGILRVIDYATKRCLMETKAHASDCQDISVYENGSTIIVASCGRDRTAQLFHRLSGGTFEHFQTLEFAAKVVQVLVPSQDKVLTCSLDRTIQVHELITKEGDPDVMAAIPSKVLSLKASPSSMVVATPDEKTIFVSLLDRSVCHYDLATGRVLNSFKCNDEGGIDSVVLDSLVHGQALGGDLSFILGISNTDKSVRIYDAQAGTFLDREWGHTEAINGVILLGEEGMRRKVVSVGSDGTIMIWDLDLQDPVSGSLSRDPSPEKSSSSAAQRPPLRRVLSKAELAEFQRPSSSTAGRRSPPRPLQRRSSKYNLSASASRTPGGDKQANPASIITEHTPSRQRSSGGSPSISPPPPPSPKNRIRMFRRPSLPVLNATSQSGGGGSGSMRKKSSTSNLRGGYGFGSLSMATEQTCRQLRAYRKKLDSTDPINHDVLAELDAELRLTAAALGERAIRSRSHNHRGGGGDGSNENSETLLSGLLDQYHERLVSMLDEKLGLGLSDEDKGAVLRDIVGAQRPRTAFSSSGSSGSSASSSVTEARG